MSSSFAARALSDHVVCTLWIFTPIWSHLGGDFYDGAHYGNHFTLGSNSPGREYHAERGNGSIQIPPSKIAVNSQARPVQM